MKKALQLFAIVLLTTTALFGQSEWLPVSEAELKMDAPIVDKNADAEAIFWDVRIDDKKRSKVYFDHYIRVKIFNERGMERFSKVEVLYYKGLKIEDLSARVIKPDGTITEISQSEIFDREIVRANKFKVRAKSFAVPGIEPGIILEYKYKERFKDAGINGSRLFFQRDIPMQRVSYHIRPAKNARLSPRFFNMEPIEFVRDVFDDEYFVATRKNVPAFTEEPMMAPEDTVKPWVLLRYSGFRETWSGYGSMRSRAIGYVTEPDKTISAKAKQITQGAANTEQKVRRIYDYVRTEIKNLDFTDSSGKTKELKKLSDVIKYGYGTVIDIELLFVSLCRSINIPAYVAYASDRSEFFLNPNEHPFLDRYIDYGFVAVSIDGKKVYLNPGIPYLAYGKLIWYEENIFALVANEVSYRWEPIPLSDYNQTKLKRKGRFKLDKEGTLTGSVEEQLNGHLATDLRAKDFRKTNDERISLYKERLEKAYDSAEYSNVNLQGVEDPEQPIKLTYDLKIPNYALMTGTRMFVVPVVFESKSKPVFSSNDRKYPIYFRYPKSEEDEIEIELPEGFTLESQLPAKNIEERKKLAGTTYSLDYDESAHKLTYTRNHFIGGGSQIYFGPNAYPALKRLFDLFHKSDTHSLALKRTELP